MTAKTVHKTKRTSANGRGKGLRPWRGLGFFGRVWRVLWVGVVMLFLFTLLQVFLGWLFNPPLTPLMVQRFFQQVGDKERAVRLERHYVPLDKVSNNLITAVVYAEDGLFLYHHGFDVKQMKAACRENQAGKRMRGGSTISNQTAKNAFLPHNRTVCRKAAEAYYTVLIETVWGKRRIMEVYLNVVEFGDGIYGAEAASQYYFGHPAATLSRTEAAQLAASLPSPLNHNPAHQTPYFKRRVANIKSRFNWGEVDVDMPRDKRREKMKKQKQETLLDFLVWYIKQK